MEKNIALADRVLRATFAIIIGVLFLTGTISGITATVLAIVALIILGTSFGGSCPIYSALHIRTKRSEHTSQHSNTEQQ